MAKPTLETLRRRNDEQHKAFSQRLPEIKKKYEGRRIPKSLRTAIRRFKEEERRGLHEAQSRHVNP